MCSRLRDIQQLLEHIYIQTSLCESWQTWPARLRDIENVTWPARLRDIENEQPLPTGWLEILWKLI